ncbi:MAG: EamA/RhaT family transporter [Gammaproteobacteria bacterium]|jgi:drug/metabolite transporter (DMT)-like permease|nr:EamA/RhaT family transporter [Gammaproteobacteria bacterium]
MARVLAFILAGLSALFWAGNMIAGKLIVSFVAPLPAAAVRFIIASILLVLILVFFEKNYWPVIKKNLGVYALLGLIGIAGFNYFLFLGLKYTSAVNGALIMATNPIVTLLLSALILKEKIKSYQKIGIIFSLAGVVIVITHASIDMLIHLHISIGDAIILAGNICWALYSVLSKRFVQGGTAIINTSTSIIIGTLILLILCNTNFPSPVALQALPWHVNAGFLYMAVFGTVLAFLFWNYSVHHLGASNTAIFMNLMPVFTMLLSLALGTPVSLLQVLGGALVILGVLISSNTIRLPQMKLSKGINDNASL